MSNMLQVLMPVVLLALSGCGRAEWFYGTWNFDRDFTLGQLTNSVSLAPKPTTPDVPDWVSPHPLLVIGQLDGATYTFGANDFTASSKGRVTRVSYEVLKRPNPNEIVIRTEKGDTNDLRLVGNRMEIDAHLGFRLYFSRGIK